MIALPGLREAGLILGAVIVAAAGFTVVRRRELSHLVPLGPFVTLLTLAAIPS